MSSNDKSATSGAAMDFVALAKERNLTAEDIIAFERRMKKCLPVATRVSMRLHKLQDQVQDLLAAADDRSLLEEECHKIHLLARKGLRLARTFDEDYFFRCFEAMQSTVVRYLQLK